MGQIFEQWFRERWKIPEATKAEVLERSLHYRNSREAWEGGWSGGFSAAKREDEATHTEDILTTE